MIFLSDLCSELVSYILTEGQVEPVTICKKTDIRTRKRSEVDLRN